MTQANLLRVLLLCSGLVLLFAALLYNEFLLGLIDPNPPLKDTTVETVRWVQLIFFLSSLVLIGASEFMRRVSWLRTATSKKIITNISLSILAVLLPIFILELSLRPFTGGPQKTNIFIEDSELGWKLKPNVEGIWGNVKLKINAQGLRGPELSYASPLDVRRILYLGDSVLFGYKLESHEQTYPYLTEIILEETLGLEIESINAGVGGYSPWQEYLYLSKEGIKYGPDLIVVSFVLNDVAEKFGLIRFGGTGIGFQLGSRASSRLDALVSESSIIYFGRRIAARIILGRDVQRGAEQKEVLDVQSLADHPERADVQRAWNITLENLGKIINFSRDRNIPLIIVVFPYAFQFDNVDTLSTPQRIVGQFALDNDVPVIDLLPPLSEEVKNLRIKPEDYFLDADHLSPLGSETVANIIAGFIQREGLIAMGATKP